MARTDADELLYLRNTSVDGSGRITHSQIPPERDDSMRFLVNVEAIPTARLDSVFGAGDLPELADIAKVDVGGVGEKIIAGGARLPSS